MFVTTFRKMDILNLTCTRSGLSILGGYLYYLLQISKTTFALYAINIDIFKFRINECL